jgi:hypothetical protein
MKLNLPPIVLAMLEQRGGIFDPNLRGSQEYLGKMCTEQGYPLHPSVMDFEATFGGLVLPDDEAKVGQGEPEWFFGTFACLSGGGHVAPRGGGKGQKRVPVVYSPRDIVYFLDAQGCAYAQDTIEDTKAVLYASNGTALVCRILLDDAFFSRKETSVELKGLQGEALSQRFALSRIAEASGPDLRYYSDAKGEIVLVEDIKAKQTRCACTTMDQINAFKATVAPSEDKLALELSPLLIPLLGKSRLRMVAAQLESFPDIFDYLRDLRELDVSSNGLEALPDSLWRATELIAMDISFNSMTTLTDGIGNLKSLRSLSLRGCPLRKLPSGLTGAKQLTKLNLSACAELDVDAALEVIAKLPKLKDLTLPLSISLTSLAPLAHLPLKSLQLNGIHVRHPDRLPAGLGQLHKLSDLRIEYADDIAQLPANQEDIDALRLLFSKRFTYADIRQSALMQPSKLYLRAFADSL